ncbi:DUF5076 domain-containing protein [Phenylobacterium sp.]|uniref:DUF5076 domain-containing protein n=1 Tax=Phenylobacterium sp. TaxID=1871053 RepID=UPI00351EC4B4
MTDQTNGLPVPAQITDDPRAIEMLRVWAAGGQQVVSLNPNLWDDPAHWGIMLVDLAKHIASAYAQSGRYDSTSALDRLKQGFDVEWTSPTDASPN